MKILSQPKDGNVIGPFENEERILDIPRFRECFDTGKFRLTFEQRFPKFKL